MAKLHPLTWLAWLCAALTLALLTRNPLYLLLLWFTLLLVFVRLPVRPEAVLPFSPLMFVLVTVPLAAALNLLLSPFGESVLWRIPLWQRQLTLESLVYGTTNGLLLGVLFTAFAAFNRAVSPPALLRFAPRAFYPLAVITAIALNFVPAMQRQLQAIREAQAIRGHHLRGWRDTLPLFLPLLVGGLERALQLAEAMTARGFAPPASQRRAAVRWLLLLGLLFWGAAGILALVWGSAALWLLLPGGALALSGWQLAGHAAPRTAYRPMKFSARDAAALVGCALALVLFVIPQSRATLWYDPYPLLAPPSFEMLAGLGILGLLGVGMIRDKGLGIRD
ncbi:MAG: hypothetical protein OHK0052_25280 [Anaerolineales bacterium]